MEPTRLDEVIRGQLGKTLDATDFSGLGEKYEGKVRDNYTAGDRRTIVVTDRISAFDVVLGTIPFKGQVLNQLAQYWFDETAHIAANHMESVPDPNVMVVANCEPLKTEFVMRSYLTGSTSTSIWRAYERGERTFCGHDLPEGMKRHQKLPQPLLTPTTKADKGDHDMSASREELIEMGAITAEHFDRAAAIARALFEFGQSRAAERGLILVDTKYEMGLLPSGDIIVIDEIHTPDSSRYWYAEDYEARMAAGEQPRAIDKEYVRRWYTETRDYRGDGPPPAMTDEVRIEASKRYMEIFELVTGRPLVPDTSDPNKRIAANLGL